MPRFTVTIPDSVLAPDSLSSLNSFAARTDWANLPSSATFHAAAIKQLLHENGDSFLAAEALRIVAAQRMVLYIDHLNRRSKVSLPMWLDWLEKMDALRESDDLETTAQLVKDELLLSTELFVHAKAMLSTDKPAALVLYASASEIGYAVDSRTQRNPAETRQLAQAVARLAKAHSYSDADEVHQPSFWTRLKVWIGRA